MISQGRDVTRSIQPRFVYQSTFIDYYELVQYWEVNEKTNVGVFEETDYPRSFEYVKA
jgi:hypothetical protein